MLHTFRPETETRCKLNEVSRKLVQVFRYYVLASITNSICMKYLNIEFYHVLTNIAIYIFAIYMMYERNWPSEHFCKDFFKFHNSENDGFCHRGLTSLSILKGPFSLVSNHSIVNSRVSITPSITIVPNNIKTSNCDISSSYLTVNVGVLWWKVSETKYSIFTIKVELVSILLLFFINTVAARVIFLISYNKSTD